jgi:hypothetical protein
MPLDHEIGTDDGRRMTDDALTPMTPKQPTVRRTFDLPTFDPPSE